ncbi:MAG: hypothetical protein IJP29_00710 [Lachnospiraceae bacterium]|nr:hypothetical protein [Lachnospiraceae bacterium]
MKDCKKLWNVSRYFYLGVLLLATLVVLLDCVFICHDKDIHITRSGMERYVVEQQSLGYLTPIFSDLEELPLDKGSNYDLNGMFVSVCGIVLILFAKELCYSDSRTREFRRVWPVRNWVRELYDYIMVLAIIVYSNVLQFVVLLLCQNRSNSLLLSVVTGQGVTITGEQAIWAQANEAFACNMLFYMMAMIINYTWIYLGMSVTKNPLLGAGLAIVVKSCVWWIGETLFYSLSMKELLDYFLPNMYTFLNFNYQRKYGMTEIYMGEQFYTVSWSQWFAITIGILAVAVIMIIVFAKYKDMAKGKIFYFVGLDILFAFVVGLGFFAFWLEWFDFLYYELVSLILSLVVVVVVSCLTHAFSASKRLKLEVK